MLAQDFVISGYGVMARITYLWFQALGIWDLNDPEKRIVVFISLICILRLSLLVLHHMQG
jgi:hypothetical protein